MPKTTILLADNDPIFLGVWKEFLEQENYFVLTATNPTEARKLLEGVHLDLAILDIRLEDNFDDRDKSGLEVARNAGRSVPKIILTNYPHVDTVRDAYRPDSSGRSLALEYLEKKEGKEALLRTVRKALGQRDVFIVHGHDEEVKARVARFIEHLGLRPIILHEHASLGRSVIEMFEAHANVGYAIVLLTPDDVGSVKGTSEPLKPRARQNVIFELGYFVGHLGRNKVSVLFKEGVEIPSDYHGVLYIPFDPHNGWQKLLAQELRAAGIDIDFNQLL